MKPVMIFDMDGVVLDSNPYHKQVWKDYMARFDIEVTDEIFEEIVSGTTGKEAVKKLIDKDISDEQAKEHTAKMDAEYRNRIKGAIKPLNGLVSFLDEIVQQKLKYALATSAPSENIKLVMEQTQLKNYFSVIINRDHIINGKPHPDIYIKTAEVLDVNPEDCIVFEDSLAGVTAAINAKMAVVGVTTTHSADELKEAGAIFTINDFSEISVEEVIDKIFKK